MITHRIQLNQLLDLTRPVAELGCAEGYFSAEILRWGVEKLYMVDNYATISWTKGDGASEQSWHDSNMKKALDRVSTFAGKFKLLRGITWDMASSVENNSLGMVYLDAGHSYEDVKRDLLAWAPKVIDGGIIAGHDYEMKQYGVKQAVQEFCMGRYNVNLIPENKLEDAGFWFRK